MCKLSTKRSTKDLFFSLLHKKDTRIYFLNVLNHKIVSVLNNGLKERKHENTRLDLLFFKYLKSNESNDEGEADKVFSHVFV